MHWPQRDTIRSTRLRRIVDGKIVASCPHLAISTQHLEFCTRLRGEGCHHRGWKLQRGPPEATRKPRPSISLFSRSSQVPPLMVVYFPTKHWELRFILLGKFLLLVNINPSILTRLRRDNVVLVLIHAWNCMSSNFSACYWFTFQSTHSKASHESHTELSLIFHFGK